MIIINAPQPPGFRRSGTAEMALRSAGCASSAAMNFVSRSSLRTRSFVVGKYRYSVVSETSAAVRMSSTVVASYPLSVNNRSAWARIVCRVRAFLQSRNPGTRSVVAAMSPRGEPSGAA